MERKSLTQIYMHSVIGLGLVALLYACLNLEFANFDLQFLFLVGLTLGFGSRISVRIPSIKTHISVSDTFIFLALLWYGGEAAMVLAAIEAFISSWRFCNRKITVFFNASAMALSTGAVVLALDLIGLEHHSHATSANIDFTHMLKELSLLAVVQFLANTSLATVYDAMKAKATIWQTWKSKYAWTFITYLVGAITAGAMVQFSSRYGFGVVIAAFPVIFFVYLAYRMYLENVEMSLSQAKQAEEHAEIMEQQATALKESEERFRSAFNYAPIGIALVSASGQWLRVNHALCELLGYTEEEMLSSDFTEVIHPEELGETWIKIHEVVAAKAPHAQMEQRYIHRSGAIVWTIWSVSLSSKTDNGEATLIFQLQDNSDRKSAEAKLQFDASHDSLTGLPNRAHFMNRLTRALQRRVEDASYGVSVLFIDLDRFKYVNDSLGHLVGDMLLVTISERLRKCLRPADMVARLGGDEFTILVEGHFDGEEVVRISERFQAELSRPFNLKGNEIYSSASIGILNATSRHSNAEEMMRDADTAMYHAKRTGKARHSVFNDEMHNDVRETLRIETDLRRAVEKGELTVHYQPIFSMTTQKIEGVEALARWNHRELGDISPSRFIPIAEEIGMIDALCEHMMRTACREIREIQTRLPEFGDLMLSVNLSVKQFAQNTLVPCIMGILEETDFRPCRLRLEITESVFFEYRERAIDMLNQLRAEGIELNIDDFGTGYSNLSYLLKLPISTLKIDRSFISQIEETGNNFEIVKTIAMLAKTLGVKVIAEGVETEQQLDILRGLDCEGVQGFYFARPMSYETSVKYFENNAQLGGKDVIPPSEIQTDSLSIN